MLTEPRVHLYLHFQTKSAAIGRKITTALLLLETERTVKRPGIEASGRTRYCRLFTSNVLVVNEIQGISNKATTKKVGGLGYLLNCDFCLLTLLLDPTFYDLPPSGLKQPEYYISQLIILALSGCS